MLIAEYIIATLNAILLIIEGVYDRRMRGIPIKLVLLHLALGLASLATRYMTLSLMVFFYTYSATLVIIALLAIVYYVTGLMGQGDIIVVAIASITAPFTPVGCISKIPIISPLSIAVTGLLLLNSYRRSTNLYYLRGIGKVRARLRYAIEFKRGEIVDETPIYIEGYGFIDRKTLKNREELSKLIANTHDYTQIYTVPSYPFIFHYSYVFIATYLVLTILSLFIETVVRACL